ncbi:MAG: hypothetical protein J6V01_04705, partial [Clostridia bacterium]|nr:hypothetical protein [Clostridia bacterium]
MKYLRAVLCLLFSLLLLLSGCGKKETGGEYVIKDDSLAQAAPSFRHERVFYEIFVGSFSDSDGDGTGDLRGIINRLDYLNDGDPASGKSLGVEGLWLTPIFSSPSYHKYDVTDYYEIDPVFGNMDDLKELINLCHERDMLIILDLPINHTARMNEWYGNFVAAHRQGDTENEYYNFYCWYDGDTSSAPAGRSYTQVSGTNHYVECNFSGDMPELDFDQPAVREAVYEIAKYYIELGVDGFRFDAAKYVYFGDNPNSLAFWKEYLGRLRELDPDLYTVAEVWDGDSVTDLYSKVTNCFDFTVSQAGGLISETAQKGDANRYVSYVEKYLDTVKAKRTDATIIPFIANHDMDRAAGYLSSVSGYIQMAANLYILGPGSPFIYYGEEIGIKGSRGGANTDANRRLAMLWGDGDAVSDPVGSTYPESARLQVPVIEQIKDETSLYTYYKRVIAARRANPEIAQGDYKAVNVPGQKAAGFTSTYNGSSVTVLHNPSGSSVTIDLASIGVSANEIRAVLGAEDATLENG